MTLQQLKISPDLHVGVFNGDPRSVGYDGAGMLFFVSKVLGYEETTGTHEPAASTSDQHQPSVPRSAIGSGVDEPFGA